MADGFWRFGNICSGDEGKFVRGPVTHGFVDDAESSTYLGRPNGNFEAQTFTAAIFLANTQDVIPSHLYPPKLYA